MKQCSHCKRSYPPAKGFYNNKRAKDGYASWCKKCSDVASRKYQRNHLEYKREYDRKRDRNAEKRKLRREVLVQYGGNPPKCACCGESEYIFLCLDHVNNDGWYERNVLKLEKRQILYRARKKYRPDRYQILCHNCNMGKQIKGECPHKAILE